MKRFQGNTGRYVSVPEPEIDLRLRRDENPRVGDQPEGREEPDIRANRSDSRETRHRRQDREEKKTGPPADPPGRSQGLFGSMGGLSGLSRLVGTDTVGKIGAGLSGVLSKFDLSNLDTEDLLLMAVLFLMYRESGDTELLIMLAVMFFL